MKSAPGPQRRTRRAIGQPAPAGEGVPWKRWLALLLFVAVLATAFVNLGRWQLDRLGERRGKNATVVAHENAPVVGYEQIFTRPIEEADQWRKVRVSGTFDPEHQLVVRYRSNAGQTGWQAVAPLRATDGRAVLVSRGFVQRQPGTDFPSVAPPVPSGTVTVTGYVRRNEQDPEATVPAQGSVRLINSDAIGAAFGIPLVNGYIDALEMSPAQQGGFVPVAPPPLDEGPHFSYALQWFAFTLIALAGLVVFIRNDIRDRRAAKTRADAPNPERA